MLLQELQAASLGGEGAPMEPAMQLALDANFDSVQGWRQAFAALGQAAGTGAGWLLLVFRPREGTLVNQWVADPTQAAAHGVPLLALGLPEPGRPLSCGAAADDGISARLDDIHWAAVYARYQEAVYAASETLGAGHDECGGALLLDVRRAGVFERAPSMIPGARWYDPAFVARWSAELPAGREVLVYCVYGHEVGRATTLRLRAAGLNARYLRGGIDGWQAAGQPLVDRLPPAAP